jgi:hypothetical protein
MPIAREGADPDELEEEEFMEYFEDRKRRKNGIEDELLSRLTSLGNFIE